MKDAHSAVARYATILVLWIVPIGLMLVPILYPSQSYLRDALVLPAIVITLYAAFLVAPLVQPLRNMDLFDEIPGLISRYTDEQRARREARDLLRLYEGDSLPRVYDIQNPTRFQRDLLHTCEDLRAAAQWHENHGEISGNLLERIESLMTRDVAAPSSPAEPKSARKRRSGR